MSFETANEIAVRAAVIKASSTLTGGMPPGNATRMTEEERAVIVR